MEPYIIKSHVDGQFIREVENEFNKTYPFLRIEFTKHRGDRPDDSDYEGADGDIFRSEAKQLLRDEVGLKDDMMVNELETALQSIFATSVTILRKSGNSWIETRMTRNWTLKQQNDLGKELI